MVTTQATWSSSSVSVATVTGAGVVTSVGAGEADIFASYQGVTGRIRIAVLASYSATWTGTVLYSNCTESAGFGICGSLLSSSFTATFAQSGSSVTGTMRVGTLSGNVSGSVDSSGRLTLADTSFTIVLPFGTGTHRISGWTASQTSASQMTVSYTTIITIPAGTPGQGQAVLNARITGATKS